MKEKIFLILTFSFLQVNCVFSQCISIELSITWEMGHDIFKKDSAVNIPILNITYRNNCNTNYYFFKVSPRKDESTMVMCLALRQYEDHDYLKRAKSHLNYTEQHFNVIMGGEPWYNAGWKICNDAVDYHKEYSFESIECCLKEIYDYIYLKNYSDYEIKMPYYFVPSDITPENILGSIINNQFVFLKPGEIHVDTYNLIGFKLVEGCFTFIIDQEEIRNYVESPQLNGVQKIKLPSVVGEYQLYSGAFNTNKVTVCFGEK
jgi:hypothetical protein